MAANGQSGPPYHQLSIRQSGTCGTSVGGCLRPKCAHLRRKLWFFVPRRSGAFGWEIQRVGLLVVWSWRKRSRKCCLHCTRGHLEWATHSVQVQLSEKSLCKIPTWSTGQQCFRTLAKRLQWTNLLGEPTRCWFPSGWSSLARFPLRLHWLRSGWYAWGREQSTFLWQQHPASLFWKTAAILLVFGSRPLLLRLQQKSTSRIPQHFWLHQNTCPNPSSPKRKPPILSALLLKESSIESDKRIIQAEVLLPFLRN